jgi:hypothetical protein
MMLVEWINSLPDSAKVALIALTGVLISALIAFTSARKSLYINSVSIERSKWIERLRQNIATCSGQLLTLSLKITGGDDFAKTKECTDYADKINALVSLIKLQLNARGRIDRNIIKILDALPTLALQKNPDKFFAMEHLLILHSQWLLKMEWQTVKYEAAGIFRKTGLRLKAVVLMCRYRNFELSEGRIPQC